MQFFCEGLDEEADRVYPFLFWGGNVAYMCDTGGILYFLSDHRIYAAGVFSVWQRVLKYRSGREGFFLYNRVGKETSLLAVRPACCIAAIFHMRSCTKKETVHRQSRNRRLLCSLHFAASETRSTHVHLLCNSVYFTFYRFNV